MANTDKSKRHPRKLLVVAVASLALNIILLGSLVVGYILQKNGYFDYATINNAVDTLCSKEFQDKAVKKLDGDQKAKDKLAATLVYQCGEGEASQHYNDGLKEFLKSKGIEE